MDLTQELTAIKDRLDVLVAQDWYQKTSLPEASEANAALPVLGQVLSQLAVLDSDLLTAHRFAVEPYAAGHKAQHSYLTAITRCSANEARRRCRVSKSLRSMSHVRAALIDETISFGHFDVLVQASRAKRRRAAFVRDEANLVAVASELGVTEFQDYVKRWMARVDPDGVDAADQARRDDAQVHASVTFDDMVRIDGWLDPVGGEVFTQELERLETRMFKQDWAEAVAEHGEGHVTVSMLPGPGNRRARALIEMATRSAAYDHDAEGLVSNFMVHVVIDPTTMFREAESAVTGIPAVHNPNRICELENGVQISPRSALLMAALGKARRVLVDSKGVILEFGAAKRLFDGALKEAIVLRDKRCAHPGCDRPSRNCQIDHIQPWRITRQTNIANGEPRCS